GRTSRQRSDRRCCLARLRRASSPPERRRSSRLHVRATVVHADEKDHALDEPERMLEHESLHLAVVAAAPVRPGQERPAALDLAPLRVVAMEPRRSDDPAVSRVARDQGTAGLERLAKEGPKVLLLVAILDGVLLPNERVRSHREEIIEILGSKRPEG